MMNFLFKDIRYSIRGLVKHPGFTLVAIITLGLGIGVNTAILSTVNGFILRPINVPRASEVVMPFWGSKKEAEVWGSFSYANYVDLRDQNKSFAGLLAWNMVQAGISETADRDTSGGRQAELAWGETVSGNYFSVLELTPLLGRGFLPEDDRSQSSAPVVVLGYKFWQRRFNSDPSVVGKIIYMNGSPFTIVGVGPKNYEGVKFAIRQDFWVPLMQQAKFQGGDPAWEKERNWANLLLLGRLKPGVTMKQAEADLNMIAENLALLYPDKAKDTKIQVVLEQDGRYDSIAKWFRLAALIAICVSGLVLLVACANVANLMLARATSRTKEIGIRLAIGAGRWHIVRQLLTESLILALLGGVVGWVLAYWGTNLIHSSIPPLPYPINLDVSPDLTVLRWMFGVSVLTGLIFGLAPALIASRMDLVSVLKSEVKLYVGRGATRRVNLRAALVVAQLAISIVVLVCAGLFLRSLSKALKTDPGFNVDNLVTMRIDPGGLGYDTDSGKRFYNELLHRIEEQPGVRSASLASYMLLGDSNSGIQIIKEGDPEPLPNQGTIVDRSLVAPRYLETMGIKLLHGRDFTDRDDANAPHVAIVNQEFARKFYGSEQNALGKRLRFWWTGAPLVEIVGITKDGLYRSLYEDRRPYIFIPEYQMYESGMTLMVKANSASDVGSVASAARREITRLDPRLPVVGMLLGGQNLTYAYWGPRLSAGIGTAFGLLALLLTTMGLYSVMTYAVSQRTREIGIRMALGAQLLDVMKLVLKQGIALVIVGIVIGLAGALLVTRALSSLLLNVGTTDPLTFIAVSVLLVLVALLACYIPARRAAKVDPLVALKYE
jgi:macrolide transport system ATP-binding/permease protein